jgi:hypothetical protein
VNGQQTHVGRNRIHNPGFQVRQRGNGPFTAGYSADRWLLQSVNDTVSFSCVAIADAGRTAIGDEAAIWALSNTFTGNAGATSYNYIEQRIEDPRQFAGKNCTLSFWAIAGAGTPKLGINYLQSFGTGGSPSGAVRQATGASVTLSTTWTRYTVPLFIPSLAGKTFGTNNDQFFGIELWYSAAANAAAISGNIGVQSGSISLWGVQFEVGSIATPLEKPDYRYDLANCQRFYSTMNFSIGGYNTAGNAIWQTVSFPQTMRAPPTANAAGGSTVNASGVAIAALGPSSAQGSATATATGPLSWTGTTLIFSADL